MLVGEEWALGKKIKNGKCKREKIHQKKDKGLKLHLFCYKPRLLIASSPGNKWISKVVWGGVAVIEMLNIYPCAKDASNPLEVAVKAYVNQVMNTI